MTTDNKTLADVQPGGRVRLEQEARDHRWNDVGERCLDCGDKDWMGGACSGPRSTAATGPWLSITNAPNDGQQHIRGLWVTSRIDGKPDTREWRQFIGVVNDEGAFVDPDYGETFGWEADEYDAWMPAAVAPGAALSAQPSPGGQDAAIKAMAESLLCAESSATLEDAREQAALLLADALPHLVARQPVGDQCPDDLAVDAFAAAMKAKMAAARAKGRGGWEDPAQCTAEDLSRMLRNHVEKGDPRDVANFCMMLHQRGEAIAARQPVGEPVTVEAVATVRRNGDGDRYIDWLTEGGIADLEVGDVLMVSDRAITDEDGSGEVYAAPPAQAVDLGEMPDGWRLSKKTTCYQLSHGNDIIGNLVGPDAEENAAIIARVLDSQAVGK